MLRILTITLMLGLMALVDAGQANAANTCGKLQRIQGRDIVVNVCGTCQNIHVVRSRGGGALPEVRSFRVEQESRLALPYKGPGSTRITGSDACTPELGNTRQVERKVAELTAQCILKADLANGYVLLNRCPACRQTIVRWQFPEGSEQNLPVTIEARTTINVPRGAEIGLSVIHEEPCKG